jgi:DNA-directed RNA polymerase subunit M/transcription elongation factor TFIIS
MRYCDKCGSLLLPSKKQKGELVFNCPCGEVYTFGPDDKKTYKLTDSIDNTKHMTAVFSDDSDRDNGAVTKVCPRCGHAKAIMSEIPPMYGDEETIFRDD